MAHKKEREEAGLQITSLLDAMTILLLFLLKNMATEGVILTNADGLVLPLSESKKVPKTMSLQIAMTPTRILLDNKEVIKISAVRGDTINDPADFTIDTLQTLLQQRRDEEISLMKIGAIDSTNAGKILIQADKNTEYDMIYKIMSICGKVGYNKIKFVVMQKDQG